MQLTPKKQEKKLSIILSKKGVWATLKNAKLLKHLIFRIYIMGANFKTFQKKNTINVIYLYFKNIIITPKFVMIRDLS